MAKETLQSYVEFFYAGVFVSESSIEPVSSRDPTIVNAPRESYGYRFFDRQEYKATDGEVLLGEPRNYSGMHFFGKAMTLEDVQREFPDRNIVQRNMIDNGWERVVKTRIGEFQPLEEEDVIVAEK